MEAYRLKDIKIKTYDGRDFPVETEGTFSHPRKVMEEQIIKAMRKVVLNDIPVAATFTRVPV